VPGTSGRRMHADEVDTDIPLVRRLLAGQFPRWAELPLRPVPSAGTDNALYRLGDDMVVRLPRIHWAVESVDKEHRWLPWLSPQLPVAIPVPLGKGSPAQGYFWHWSVYSWLEGRTPRIDALADPHSLALDVAGFVAALQRIDPTDAPPTAISLAKQDAQVRPAIAALGGMIDTDAATAAWNAALRLPEWTGPLVWTHSDLAPGNLLLTDGRLTGVIDFSAAGVTDPSSDLRVAWNLLPADARDVFRDALQVDDATWERGRGRALAQALVQLPYYRDTNPTLAANARHVIREILTDL
jgi:aminoglycoside phosphotransferase (APT) family kinase protein